jgi:hypothetical protein
MIKNASELLASFIAAERKKVELIDMVHMPTLGSAYEAIANAGIENEFVLPPNLDLRVVSGFIEGMPNQLDGMLVKGEGKRFGLTDQYIYPIEQVLCVIEVKKTLKKSDLVDGIQHLAAVQRVYLKNFFARYEAGEKFDFRLASESYAKLTGRAGPRTAATPDRLLYAMLARQLYAPVTVLLGFDGYGTEHGLREAMLDIVKSNIGNDSNISPELLPSFITSGTYSLVKLTGRPYMASGSDDGWVLLASARHNVARILLEFIWTKISVYCAVRMPFGLDMDHENLKELLVARGAAQGDRIGFELKPFSYPEKELRRAPISVWEPTKLSAGAIALAEFVSMKFGRLELDRSLADFIQTLHGTALEDAVSELVSTSTFCRRENTLEIVTRQALIASLDDGFGYLDVDAARLEAWCAGRGYEPSYMKIVKIG